MAFVHFPPLPGVLPSRLHSFLPHPSCLDFVEGFLKLNLFDLSVYPMGSPWSFFHPFSFFSLSFFVFSFLFLLLFFLLVQHHADTDLLNIYFFVFLCIASSRSLGTQVALFSLWSWESWTVPSKKQMNKQNHTNRQTNKQKYRLDKWKRIIITLLGSSEVEFTCRITQLSVLLLWF